MATRPNSIRKLQRKLYLRSKQKPEEKFYSLYDKLYRPDVLRAAYAQCKENKGSPGIDGLSFTQLEDEPNGSHKLLDEIAQELRSRAYRPNKIKRVMIPKSNGEERPLGIATIKDRIVQTAITLVMQPIYEPHFHEGSYGYRPKRRAQGAVRAIESYLKQGYEQVLDADLSGYFDSIPHAKLMEKVAKRISDQSILKLVEKTLKAPMMVFENSGKTRVLPSKIGVPQQGSSLSPLLANLYLNDFVLEIASKTPCKIITYADDFVILSKNSYTEKQLDWIVKGLGKEGLTLNAKKTRSVDMSKRGEEFNFLGFRFKKVKGFYRNVEYIKIEPSKKSQKKFKDTIRSIVKHRTPQTLPILVERVNRVIRGWKNYFGATGYPRKIFFLLDWFTVKRFYLWSRSRSQRRSKYLSQGAWKKLARVYYGHRQISANT